MNCKSLFFLVVFSLTLISGVFAQNESFYSWRIPIPLFTVYVSPAAISAGMEFPGENERE